MNDVITPKDVKSVEQTVQWALSDCKTLDIVGSQHPFYRSEPQEWLHRAITILERVRWAAKHTRSS